MKTKINFLALILLASLNSLAENVTCTVVDGQGKVHSSVQLETATKKCATIYSSRADIDNDHFTSTTYMICPGGSSEYLIYLGDKASEDSQKLIANGFTIQKIYKPSCFKPYFTDCKGEGTQTISHLPIFVEDAKAEIVIYCEVTKK